MEEPAMSFAHPLWFLVLALIPLLTVLYWRAQQLARRHLQSLVSPRLQAQLAGSVHRGRRALRFLLLMIALALGILALAQPRYGTIENHVERKGRDVLFAIDTSKSMLSNDTAPDRLTRAKLAAEDLLNALQGDRAGLIAFAGSAFLQAPMTIDYGAVRDSIDALDTNVIPQGGTDITGAIHAAEDAFGKGESSNRALIIFSDGEDLQDDAVQAAKDVAGKIRIFTVGIGTTEGSLIPVPNDSGGTDFVKDQDGNLVKSHLDPSRLKQIAEATGGSYIQLGDSFNDMNQLYSQGIAKLAEQNIDARLSSRPIERYQWPLGAALLVLAMAHLISDRRKSRKPPALPTRSPKHAAVEATLAAMLLLGTQAKAEDALQLYKEGKFPEANQSFKNALNQRPDSPELQFDAGASAYQAGNYDEAVQDFGKVMESDNPVLRNKAQYNLGSSLFQRGTQQKSEDDKTRDWENSIQHFTDALKADPKNADAQYNGEVVKKALEELKRQQEEKKQQQQQQDQQKQDQKDQQNQQQQGGGQPQKDQQKKSSQDQKSQDQSGQNNSQQSQDQQQKQQSQNSQDQKEQNQQGQQDQQKNQTGQDGKQDQQKGQQGDQQKSDRTNYQNGSPSPSPGENSQKSQGQQDQSQSQQPANNQPQPGASPSGTPRQGNLEQAQAAASASPSPGSENGAAAAAEESGKPGEMTPEQARLLLESLKGDESKVQLNEHPATGPVLKDW